MAQNNPAADDSELYSTRLELEEPSYLDQVQESNNQSGPLPKIMPIQKTLGLLSAIIPQEQKVTHDQTLAHLLEALESCQTFISSHPLLPKVSDSSLSEETLPLRQKMVEAAYTLQTVLSHFEVDVQLPIFSQITTTLLKFILELGGYFNTKSKIIQSLTSIGYYFYNNIDLSALEAYVQSENTAQKILDFVSNDSSNTEKSKVGSLHNRNYTKNLQRVLERVSKIFLKNFRQILESGNLNKINIFSTNAPFKFPRLSTIYGSLIPFRHLSTSEISVLIKCVMEEHLIGAHSYIFIFELLAANPNFVFTPELQELTSISIFRTISMNKALQNNKSRAGFCKSLAFLFGHLLFAKNENTTLKSTQRVVKMLKEMMESLMESMHPKDSGDRIQARIAQEFSSSFASIFLSKIDNIRDQETKDYVKTELEDLYLKIVNFAVYCPYYKHKVAMIVSLCELNPSKFVSFILERLRTGFEQNKFEKKSLVKIFNDIMEIVLRSEESSDHLQWIIPVLVSRFNEASDIQELVLIFACVNTIARQFIEIDSIPQLSHLSYYQDDLETTFVDMFKTFIEKSKSFNMGNTSIVCLLKMSDYVFDECFQIFKPLVLRGGDNIIVNSMMGLVQDFALVNYSKVEKLLLEWINKQVIEKNKEGGQDLKDLLMGSALSHFGISSMEYQLASENTTIIQKNVDISFCLLRMRMDAMRNMTYSQEYLKILGVITILLVNHSDKKVRKVGEAKFSSFLKSRNVSFKFYGSKQLAKNLIKQKSQEDSSPLKELVYEDVKQGYSQEQLLQITNFSFLGVIRQIRELMTQIDSGSTSVGYESNFDGQEAMRQTLSGVEGENENSGNATLGLDQQIINFFSLLNVLNSNFRSKFISLQMFNSPSFSKMFTLLKNQILQFLLKKQLFGVATHQQTIRNFLWLPINMIQSLVKSDHSPFQQVNFWTFNPKNRLRHSSIIKQVKTAEIRCLAIDDISQMCGISQKSRNSIELATTSNQYFTNLLKEQTSSKMEEETSTPSQKQFFIFRTEFMERLMIKNCFHQNYSFLYYMNINMNNNGVNLIQSSMQKWPILFSSQTKLRFENVMLDIDTIIEKSNNEEQLSLMKTLQNLSTISTQNYIDERYGWKKLIKVLEKSQKFTQKQKLMNMIVANMTNFVTRLDMSVLQPVEGDSEVLGSLVGELEGAANSKGFVEFQTLFKVMISLVAYQSLLQQNQELISRCYVAAHQLLEKEEILKRGIALGLISFLNSLVFDVNFELQRTTLDDASFYNDQGVLDVDSSQNLRSKILEIFGENSPGSTSGDASKLDSSWSLDYKYNSRPSFGLERYIKSGNLSPQISPSQKEAITENSKAYFKLYMIDLLNKTSTKKSFTDMLSQNPSSLFIANDSNYSRSPLFMQAFQLKNYMQSIFTLFGEQGFGTILEVIESIVEENKQEEDACFKLQTNFIFGSLMAYQELGLPSDGVYTKILAKWQNFVEPFLSASKQPYHERLMRSVILPLVTYCPINYIHQFEKVMFQLVQRQNSPTCRATSLKILSCCIPQMLGVLYEDKIKQILDQISQNKFTESIDIAYYTSFLRKLLDFTPRSICLRSPLFISDWNSSESGVTDFKGYALHKDKSLGPSSLYFSQDFAQIVRTNLEQVLKEAQEFQMIEKLTYIKSVMQAFMNSADYKDTMVHDSLYFELLFTLTSTGFANLEQVIKAFMMIIHQSVGYFTFAEEYQQHMISRVFELYSKLENSDSKKTFLTMFRAFFRSYKKPELLDILAKIGNDYTQKTEHDIVGAIQSSLFLSSDQEMLEVVKHTSSKIQELKKSKAEDKEYIGYSLILIVAVMSRKWQLGDVVVQAMRAIFVAEKESKQVKAIYKSFVSDFWKKRYDEVELALKPLPEDIVDKLKKFKIRYNYFA